LATFEWIEFGCIHKLYPLNRIVRTSLSKTCNRNRFDSLPLPVCRTSYAVRSAITATAELDCISRRQFSASNRAV